MKLNRTERMKLPFSRKVGLMGFFGGAKTSNKLCFPICPYLRPPKFTHAATGVAEINPKKSAGAIASGFFKVLRILRKCGFAKIANPVVVPFGIDVVNIAIGHSAIRVQPSKPMCFVRDAINVNIGVPVLVQVSSSAPCDSHAAPNAPSKNTSIGIVMKKFFEALYGKMGSSHAVVPYKQWFGQKPARVSCTGGLRHFNTGGV